MIQIKPMKSKKILIYIPIDETCNHQFDYNMKKKLPSY